MESLRTDVMGDVALDLGRCKMLVPLAMESAEKSVANI
jgi:hypothetical protein